jgi:DNA mismatch endonuclease, patch repair protein
MRKIQAKNTSPEMAVRRLAHGMGFRYRLHSPKLPGRPDLVFTRLMKIVEVRGCFWHQHSGCIDSHIPKSRRDYWVPKLKRNQDRDAENLQRLKALGFRVLTVWECEVKDEKRLVTKLGRFLNR